MMLIRDIVDIDDKAEFQSDVQLDAYDKVGTTNNTLLQKYLFSTAVPQHVASEAGVVSSAGLLDELVKTFVSHQAENRQVVIANYGHGKSHLALVLANYFGRAADSPEVATVLQRLSRALNDPAKTSRYRDFKESKGAFLLVRLRGDVAESLPAQFLRGLERGLDEHDATREMRPPFWHAQAEDYLKNLLPEQKAKANTFLSGHNSELPLLLQEIRAHHDVHDLAVGAIHAATGIKPELREIGMAQAVNWAVNTLVGPGKQFGGLLVLFDEFTLYLTRNAYRQVAADLQDLLNGIANHRGQAALMAFAQEDPDTTAENLPIVGPGRTDLKKALGRLPRKHNLHSLLESVIDAYLMQKKSAWATFKQPKEVSGRLSGASNVALICYSKYYERQLRWSPTKFQEIVTEGCFPLHPLATVLLCNVKLETVDTTVPRTVLGFVMQQLKAKQNEAAVVNGRPNWVLPIALVDYFEHRLAGYAYKSYQSARRAVGAELTSEQEDVLKALLLYELGNVSVRADDQLDFLSQASGLERRPASEALRDLAASSSIRQDSSSKVYSLWPATADPQRLERALREKLKDVRFDERTLSELNRALDTQIPGITFGLQPMGVDWGHPSDWGVREEIVTADVFTATELRQRVQLTEFGPNATIREGARGYVFWALGRNDEECQYFRQNAEPILNGAFPGDSPVPVVIVLPASPQPGLIDNFLRRRALAALNKSEREDIGAEMISHEEKRVSGEMVKAIRDLRGALEQPFDVLRSPSSLAVPMAYRAAVKKLGETKLTAILSKCYDLAYRWRPPTFDTRYQVASKGSNNLRTATGRIASAFFSNASKNLPSTYQSDRFTRELYEKQLQKSWGILGPDFRLQRPSEARLAQAWQVFDDAFAPGADGVQLSPILAQLINPPFGFDFNTAVLLFAAWVGVNRADVRFSQLGSFAFQADGSFNDWLSKGAREFARQAHENAIAVARRDPGDIEKELRQLLADYRQKTYSPAEADEAAGHIQALAANDRISEPLRQQAEEACRELKDATEAALKYAQEANEIVRSLSKGLKLTHLAVLQNKLANLKSSQLVTIDAPSFREIDEVLYRSAKQASREVAETSRQLDDIGHYELNRRTLQNGQKIVNEVGYTKLSSIFDAALLDLETRRQQLLSQENEKLLRAELHRMRTDSSLAALYENRDYLANLSAQSDSTIELRDRKLADTNREIERLENEAKVLTAGVLSQRNQTALKLAYDQLMLIMNRYIGSPLAESVAATKELMERYGRFLGDLASMNRRATVLQDEKAAQHLLGELDRLEDENKAWVGELQWDMVKQVRAQVETHVKTCRNEATQWVARVDAESRATGELFELLEQLQRPPAFLSEAQELQVRQLTKRVERRIDEDALTRIEQQFRLIRDPHLQQACIARLQQLVDAKQGVVADGSSQ